MDLTRELELAMRLCRQAGARVVSLRDGGLTVDRKAHDEPVTEADRQANRLICDGLRAGFPDDGLLSEEAPDDHSRLTKERVWMVDPIDGTNDFIRGDSGFSVMIGLLVGDRPALGCVYQPVGDRLYGATLGNGTFVVEGNAEPRPIHVSSVADPTQIRMVVSKSHRDPIIDKVRAALGTDDELNVGSVGLKLALIARGDRDLYVNPQGHSKLWDALGPEVILREAGGVLTNAHGGAIAYRGAQLGNVDGLVGSNGVLHAQVLAQLAPLFSRR
jgi:3'(2'), 5'-bisphosphate nucleotidase